MEKKLSKNINLYHIVIRTIGSSLFYIGLITVIILPTRMFGEPIIKVFSIVLLSIIVVLLLIFNFLIPQYVYKLYGYEINNDYLVIKKGVIFRKNAYIPIKRIQHIEKFQGPIQTMFKLTTVIIYTAGSNEFIVGVPENEVDSVIHQIRVQLQVYLDSDEVMKDES